MGKKLTNLERLAERDKAARRRVAAEAQAEDDFRRMLETERVRQWKADEARKKAMIEEAHRRRLETEERRRKRIEKIEAEAAASRSSGGVGRRNERVKSASQAGRTTRVERDAQRNDPNRMTCCGAPKAADEVTSVYAARHYLGIDDLPKGKPCVPAYECHNNRYRKRTGSAAEPKMERGVERGPNRAECCGAPTDVPEPTSRYGNRHRKGLMGLRPGKLCIYAAACLREEKRLHRLLRIAYE